MWDVDHNGSLAGGYRWWLVVADLGGCSRVHFGGGRPFRPGKRAMLY